jgi:hypothetical protein
MLVVVIIIPEHLQLSIQAVAAVEWEIDQHQVRQAQAALAS